MKHSLRSWLWRVPIDQEIDEEIMLPIVRYANAVALTAKVSTIFSLKLSNTVRDLNLPVVEFKHTDAVTAIALVAKF
jgi:hypothetical protein